MTTDDQVLMISSISLLLSVISITWNIISHFLTHKIKMSLRIYVGERILSEDDRGNAIAAGTGIIENNAERIIQPKLLFWKITNKGNKDVEIDALIIEYKNKGIFAIPIIKDRYLKPYGGFTSTFNDNAKLIEEFRVRKIKSIFLRDTQGEKKWRSPKRDILEVSYLLNSKLNKEFYKKIWNKIRRYIG